MQLESLPEDSFACMPAAQAAEASASEGVSPSDKAARFSEIARKRDDEENSSE
jgi:hypothetical protein